MKYELLYIVHPDLENTIGEVTEKVTGFINRRKGKVLKEDNWGKRKLAYKIQKQDFGIYVLVDLEVDTQELKAIDRDIRLQEEVMRHLITRKEEIEEVKPRTSKAEKAPAEVLEEVEEPKKEEEKIKKSKKEEEKEEKERLKKVDQKLDEIIGKE